MEEVKVKQEEPEFAAAAMASFKERSWRKQQQDQTAHSRLSLPAKVAITGKKPAAIVAQVPNDSSAQRHRSSQGQSTATAGPQHRAAAISASTNHVYSLGTRCGEIFVANNARQWTFVCTFCNKSTRDIGDFICHIKIKHLEESDVQSKQYENNYYDNEEDEDDDACDQAQDYLDCGSYLDINVHTESEDFNYNNGEKYGAKYERHHQQTVNVHDKPNDNNWNAPKQQQQHLKNKPQNEEKQQNNVVQILDDSDNDIEDVLEAHTSHRKSQQQLLSQRQKYHTPENTKQRNGGNDVSLESTMDIDNEDMTLDFMDQNDGDDYADDDFDNQLLLAPNDSVESGTQQLNDGKIKRRQIRGTAYCAMCNKTFQYYSLYRNHMIKHSNETPFRCNICQKGFKSKQAIRYHMNTHQKESKFKCEICDTGFYTENQFITHVLTHENVNTFPCMVCGKVLHSDNEREAHLTTHTEERPFRCEFCQKLFRLRHHLSNHLKMHRQYRCDYCKEEFTSAVHLRKPYACPVCENSPEARTANESPQENINPLQLFEAVLPPTQPTECVDLAEMVSDSDDAENDDEEEHQGDDTDEQYGIDEPSSSVSKMKKKPFPCKQCSRGYSHLSGLNYHIRTKH